MPQIANLHHHHDLGRPEPDGRLRLVDGSFSRVRLLRPDDDRFFPAFDDHLSAEDRRLRFFIPLQRMSPELTQRLTHYDPDEAVAVVALSWDQTEMLGVARVHRVGKAEGEFAAFVRSDLKGQGLGRALMLEVLDRAREMGVEIVTGYVLHENTGMVALCRELGFTVARSPDMLNVRLDIRRSAKAA